MGGGGIHLGVSGDRATLTDGNNILFMNNKLAAYTNHPLYTVIWSVVPQVSGTS